MWRAMIIIAACVLVTPQGWAAAKAPSAPDSSPPQAVIKNSSAAPASTDLDLPPSQPPQLPSLTSEDHTLLKNLFKKYERGASLKFAKTINNELLASKKSSTGVLWTHKGLIRIEEQHPDKVLTVITNEAIWNEAVVPEALGGGVQVSKISLTGKKLNFKTMLNQIFSGKQFWQAWQLLARERSQKNKSRIFFAFRPVLGAAELTKMTIEVDAKERLLTQLQFWDDLDASTRFVFQSSDFHLNPEPKLFEYKVPKNAKVSEY